MLTTSPSQPKVLGAGGMASMSSHSLGLRTMQGGLAVAPSTLSRPGISVEAGLSRHPDGVKAFTHRRAHTEPGGSVAVSSPPPSRQVAHVVSCTSADYNHRVAVQSFAGAGSSRVSGAPRTARRLETDLPPESEWQNWSKFETDIFLQSEGAYHPGERGRERRIHGLRNMQTPRLSQAKQEVRGRVSIVAPSMESRQHYHENLWACFEAQTWEDKELIVIETYQTAPSPFLVAKAEEDSRLVHVCIKRPVGKDFTVGLKRNMTLHMASGEYVVNFDDDDLYASNYVTSMVGEMRTRGLDAVTLSAWYNYFSGQGVCTYSDPDGWEEWEPTAAELDAILYGYGFSYVHKRWLALEYPYPNVGFAEDAPFLLKLREVRGAEQVGLKKDTEGICMHIMHRANTAEVLSETVEAHRIGNLRVASLVPFQKQIDADFMSWSPWRPPVQRPPSAVAGAQQVQRPQQRYTRSLACEEEPPSGTEERSRNWSIGGLLGGA